jgi:hypothetical protein
MDCGGQWLHRVGTTRNLFVGKRCISSVNWWQQLLAPVRCGNLLALQRRTCGERTRVPAQSVSATFHPSTHPCHLVSTLLLEGAHILEAHMPGRTYRGRNCRGAHAWGRTCRGRVRTQTDVKVAYKGRSYIVCILPCWLSISIAPFDLILSIFFLRRRVASSLSTGYQLRVALD